MIGFSLYAFLSFSYFFVFLISLFSSSSELVSTALLIKIPGGLSKEYFSTLLDLYLACSLSFLILAMPILKSLCKSAI